MLRVFLPARVPSVLPVISFYVINQSVYCFYLLPTALPFRLPRNHSHEPLPVSSGVISPSRTGLASTTTASQSRSTSDHSHELLSIGLGVISLPRAELASGPAISPTALHLHPAPASHLRSASVSVSPSTTLAPPPGASRLGTLLLPVGFAFSLHLVACCRGDLRVSVSSSASPLASRFGSLSFSQLSFLAFWFCLLFFLPNQSSVLENHQISSPSPGPRS